MNTIKLTLLALGIVMAASAQAATRQGQNTPAMNNDAPSLQVSTIDHVGMNVPDIDSAIGFFSDLMDAQVISDMSPDSIAQPWKAQFRWHTSSNLQRFVMLQLAGGAKLELFQYQGPEINPVPPHGDDAGASHVALQTDDIDRSLALLKSKQITILNDPITNPDGVRWFYFQTPWGSQVELVSLPQSDRS